jgi:alpha-L-fucosidase
MNRREFAKNVAACAPLMLPGTARALLSSTDIQPATHQSPALKEFVKLQFGVSFHFSMNTFTGDDYEQGKVPASTYNPTNLDVRQWIRTAHDLGAKYAVLTAKHMSGFALWDSANYDYDVVSSPNKTDVVAEFVAACKEFGLKHGFYYCILDPHNEGVFDWNIPVKEGYYKVIKQQVTELHSKYPNTFYQLLDITWKLSADQRWELYRLIKKYSPNGVIVMNQAYYQSKKNLGRICEAASFPTDVINGEDQLPPPEGHDPQIKFEGKTYYMPMESWIPTGPPYKPLPPMNSWFWRPGFTTMSAEKIAADYEDCRKHNSNLLLNLSPDTSGRLPDEAVKTLQEAARIIKRKT